MLNKKYGIYLETVILKISPQIIVRVIEINMIDCPKKNPLEVGK